MNNIIQMNNARQNSQNARRPMYLQKAAMNADNSSAAFLNYPSGAP